MLYTHPCADEHCATIRYMVHRIRTSLQMPTDLIVRLPLKHLIIAQQQPQEGELNNVCAVSHV